MLRINLLRRQVPVYRTYSYYPQAPQIYYATPPPVYNIHPSYFPTWSGIPLPAAGINPQNPVEIESPADNAAFEDLRQPAGASGGDEDTVSVESA